MCETSAPRSGNRISEQSATIIHGQANTPNKRRYEHLGIGGVFFILAGQTAVALYNPRPASRRSTSDRNSRSCSRSTSHPWMQVRL